MLTQASELSATQHAELMRRVDNLNLLQDSNKLLRQERREVDQTVEQLKEQVGGGGNSTGCSRSGQCAVARVKHKADGTYKIHQFSNIIYSFNKYKRLTKILKKRKNEHTSMVRDINNT